MKNDILPFGKDAKSVEWLFKASKFGNTYAQVLLAWCYSYGIHVDHNADKAKELFVSAAKQNNVYAQAQCFLKGWECKQSKEKAFKHFKRALNEGVILAEHAIGHCLEYGIGVEKDVIKAFEYYSRACKRGNPISMNKLGILYEEGKGVERDYKLAAFWYNKAGMNGNMKALTNLGRCYSRGMGVKKGNIPFLVIIFR